MAARLKEMYKNEVAPALQKKFGYKSVMQIPKLDKIVINVGAGEAKDNAKVIDSISGEFSPEVVLGRSFVQRGLDAAVDPLPSAECVVIAPFM